MKPLKFKQGLAALLCAVLCVAGMAGALAEELPPTLELAPESIVIVTPEPTQIPTPEPTQVPTPVPTQAPTLVPTAPPTSTPEQSTVSPIEASMTAKAGSIAVTISASGRPVVVRLMQGGREIVRQRLEAGSGVITFTSLTPGVYDIVIDYEGDTTGLHAVTIGGVTVPEPVPAAVPIVATATAGLDSVAVNVTTASAMPVTVTLLLNGQTCGTRTIAAGVGSVSFSGLAAGTYSVKLDYATPQTGVSPTVIGQLVVAGRVTPIVLMQIIGGENKLMISGSAQPNMEIVLTTEPASGSASVTSDASGRFSVGLTCAAGTYKAVYAQYGTDVSSRVMMTGTFVVMAPADKPALTSDPISNKSYIVYAKTTPGTLVNLGTVDYGQTVVADHRGILCYSLPHGYDVGTIVTFTIFYGPNNAYSYKQTVTVGYPVTYELLTRGDKGANVYALTARLAELGYLRGAKKTYDDEVVTAVRMFQSLNSLDVDGKAGQLTQEALFSVRAFSYAEGDFYPTLVRGDRGLALITKLQERLKQLGYYTIRVDGIFGSGTERAVREFQSRNGLTANGRADHLTQKLLYSSAAKPARVSVTATTGTSGAYVTLSRSNRYNAAVVPLQRRLKELGYLSGSVDGYFGSQTYRAVWNFQSRNGLSTTGTADVQTQKLLYSASAISAAGKVGSSTASTAVTSSTVSSSVSSSFSSSATGFRELWWGCKGDDVKRLQQALLNAGYTEVRKVDGIYGQWTYDAVCAFQRENGLEEDGVAGKETLNMLYGTDY